jgi:prolyl-tRNA editing enzyme YbaK/EbsC (Cys-tRNA(Pro) deacylase)
MSLSEISGSVERVRVALLAAGHPDRADAEWVRQTTGFAIGGVAPVGHLNPPMMLLDEDLLALDPIWAAAGSPNHVFRTTRRS